MSLKQTITTATLSMMLASSLSFSAASATMKETFQFQNLKAENYRTGTNQYLVYMRDTSTGKILGMDLWNRTTNIIEKDGETLVEIKQDWHSAQDRSNRLIYSLNRVTDFSPVFHKTIHGADQAVSAFTFEPNLTKGDTNITGNTQASFSIESKPETLNWELDMETFGLLPLETGKSFHMNFYHPGSKTPPQEYIYSVTGEETLKGMNGNPLPAWILEIDYGGRGAAKFWIDKETRQTLKMEETFGKIRRYKVRLGLPIEQ